METSPSRRSTRARKPTKYSADSLDPLKGSLSEDEESENGDAPEPARDALSADGGVYRPERAASDDEEDADIMGSDSSDDEDSEDDVGSNAGATPSMKAHEDSIISIECLPGSRYPIITDEMQKSTLEHARNRWLLNPVLPIGKFGLSYSSYYSEYRRDTEIEGYWKWLPSLKSSQTIQGISEEEAQKYLGIQSNSSAFLMGPVGNQSKFSLKPGQSMNLAQAWQPSQAIEKILQQGKKEGWILNVGGRVRAMDWLPNRGKDTQILAITLSTEEALKTSKSCSPYAPLPSIATSIQLWAIAASQASGKAGQLAFSQPPKLIKALCAVWGEVKQMRWCPVARSSQDGSLGLLATVWGDGNVRILDIDGEVDFLHPASYVKLNSPMFSQSLADTVCTSVTWLSSVTIAVGHANGTLSVWDIQEPESGPIKMHRPHTSYILEVVSAYPSHPFKVASISIDGDLHMTDLDSPTLHSSSSTQQNLSSPGTLSWVEHLQAFAAFDSVGAIRLHPINNFSASVIVYMTASIPLSVATSPVHPFMLYSGAGGEVVATNPMRRLLDRKQAQYPAYRQTWFAYNWREMPSAENPPGPATSISRIMEGFKMQRCTFVEPRALDMRTAKGRTSAVRSSTRVGLPWPEQKIYPMQRAVTNVAWNSNIECGGWAAAALGCGLVRIEDLLLQ